MSESVLGKEWRVRDRAPLTPLDAHRLMARLLKLRGVDNTTDARSFLRPALPDAAPLPNLDTAVERLTRAIRGRERVAVYGDYDADGMTATAVLVEGITDLGGVAFPYIPHRFDEGYGLNEGALRGLIDRGAELVVAVDTGTGALREVAYANERRLDSIVLDHHTPRGPLPDAVAVVNPHLDGTPESHRYLSGCGVAYATLTALAAHLGADGFEPQRYLDLVAIGTVCDVVPLLGANRALVSFGLAQLARRGRPGLAALMDLARVSPTRLSTHTIGFVIGPRLNAAGRLAHGIQAYELLTTRDEARARELAQELEALNRRRQQLTDESVALGRALVAAEGAGAPIVIAGHPSFNQGIVGLVASRLVEEHTRPAIVYQEGPELSVGSARSIPGFDIHAALAEHADLMERFGGHAQAAGFTVRTDRVAELRRRLTASAAAGRDWSAVRSVLDVDVELPAEGALSPWELLTLVRQLEPCGTANPPPLFLWRRARVQRAWTVGGEKHLRLILAGSGGVRSAIGFNLGRHLPRPGAYIDVVYAVVADRNDRAELQIKDFAVVA